MSSPKMPAAPDYVGAAREQGAANVDAARVSAKLGNPNITNPYGTQTVKYGGAKVFDEAAYNNAMEQFNAQGPTQSAQFFDEKSYLAANPDVAKSSKYGGKGGAYQHYLDWGKREGRQASYLAPTRDMFTSDSDPDRVEVTQSLSPEGQKLFDQQNRISQGLGDLAEGGIGRVGQMLGTAFDSSSIPALQRTLPAAQTDAMTNRINTSVMPTSQSLQSSIRPTTTATQSTIADPSQGVSFGPGQTSASIQAGVGAPQRSVNYDLESPQSAIRASMNSTKRPVQYDIAETMARIRSGIDPTQTQLTSMIGDTDRGPSYDIGQPNTGIKGAIDSRFDQSGDQVQDALYRKQTAMLDPQYQQQQNDMISRLANQGIMPGSEAYNRELNNFARERDFAYGNARDAAILAAGNEQSRLYQLGLQGAQLANTANQQEFGQAATRTNTENAAQQQQFAQLAARAGFNNDTQGREFEQNATRAGFNNAAQAQEYGQNADRARFANEAQGQEFGQNDRQARFANDAQQQMFGQALARGGFRNAAQAQDFGQNVTSTQLNNAAQAQEFGQGIDRSSMINAANQQQFEQGDRRAQLANLLQQQEFGQNATDAAFGNAAQGQEFDQALARSGFGNQAAGQMFGQSLAANNQNFNQGLQETDFANNVSDRELQRQLLFRQLPLNEITALMSGAQVNLPQFQPYSGTQVAPANMFGALQAQGQWDQSVYNAGAAKAGGQMQAGVGLAAAAATAF